jgi:hypothetical protein
MTVVWGLSRHDACLVNWSLLRLAKRTTFDAETDKRHHLANIYLLSYLPCLLGGVLLWVKNVSEFKVFLVDPMRKVVTRLEIRTTMSLTTPRPPYM